MAVASLMLGRLRERGGMVMVVLAEWHGLGRVGLQRKPHKHESQQNSGQDVFHLEVITLKTGIDELMVQAIPWLDNNGTSVTIGRNHASLSMLKTG